MEQHIVRDAELGVDDLESAYLLHAAEIYRVVRGIVGNSAAAEDLTHEAFFRAQQNLARYDRGRPIRPWLITIAARLALDHCRRERVRSLFSNRLRLSQGSKAQIGNVDDRLDTDQVLQLLAPRERAVVVARHYLGMTYEEIAAALQMSTSNVGTVLSRAHGRIRAHLEAYGELGHE